MPSPRRADRTWSLTARLAWRFAVMTSVIVLLYAAGSTYMLYDALRDELHNFVEHEAEELTGLVLRTAKTPEELQAAVDEISDVLEEPSCAFRLRKGDGTILASSGRQRLLEGLPGPIPTGRREVGLSLLTASVAGYAQAVPG